MCVVGGGGGGGGTGRQGSLQEYFFKGITALLYLNLFYENLISYISISFIVFIGSFL